MDAVVVAVGDAGDADDADDAGGDDAVVQAAGPRRAHKHRQSMPGDSDVYLDVLQALSASPAQHSSTTGSLAPLPPHSRRSPPPTRHLVDERVACTHQTAANGRVRGNDNPVWQHPAERPARHSHHHYHDLSAHYPQALAMQQAQRLSSCLV